MLTKIILVFTKLYLGSTKTYLVLTNLLITSAKSIFDIDKKYCFLPQRRAIY